MFEVDERVCYERVGDSVPFFLVTALSAGIARSGSCAPRADFDPPVFTTPPAPPAVMEPTRAVFDVSTMVGFGIPGRGVGRLRGVRLGWFEVAAGVVVVPCPGPG